MVRILSQRKGRVSVRVDVAVASAIVAIVVAGSAVLVGSYFHSRSFAQRNYQVQEPR